MSRVQKRFTVHGPFGIPHDAARTGTSKHISLEHAAEFWAQDEVASLRRARGCYVFALGSGRGFSPWYVGKTNKGFEHEAFQPHKLVYYNEVVYRGRKGRPVMFFVAMEKPGAAAKSEIDSMETFLIQSAVFKNPELKNRMKAKFPNWGIRGVVRGGTGKSPAAAKRFKAMMGL